MIVVLAAEAEADLEQIAAYVAEQSPRSALNLVRELQVSGRAETTPRSEALRDGRVRCPPHPRTAPNDQYYLN